MAPQLPVGQALLIFEALRSHSDTPQSVGLLWTSDRPVAKTTTWQHITFTKDRLHIAAGFDPAIAASECPQIHALDHKSYKLCSESTGNGEGMELLVCRSDYKILKRIFMK